MDPRGQLPRLQCWAEKNLGESEIRDAMMAKAEYLCRIGDKVGGLSCLCSLKWALFRVSF